MSLLVAKDIALSYGSGSTVVQDFSLGLEPGELVALIGPNGAGKSSLLKALAGLLPPSRGELRLAGRGLSEWSPAERARRVALLPQTSSLDELASVQSVVEQGRYVHRGFLDRLRGGVDGVVRRSLEEVELVDHAERPILELSGGQRQRVLLARALAQETEVLLVDEPTTSLDLGHQLWTFRRLRQAAQSGRAVLLVTHDLNLASQHADRVLLLSSGRLIAQGSPDEVLSYERLAPVFGPDLRLGRLDIDGSDETRPFVLPWRREGP